MVWVSREVREEAEEEGAELVRVCSTPSALLVCDPPSVEEEAAILKYYERQLLALCSSFGFPHKVSGRGRERGRPRSQADHDVASRWRGGEFNRDFSRLSIGSLNFNRVSNGRGRTQRPGSP